jgi:hypothetical protein
MCFSVRFPLISQWITRFSIPIWPFKLHSPKLIKKIKWGNCQLPSSTFRFAPDIYTSILSINYKQLLQESYTYHPSGFRDITLQTFLQNNCCLWARPQRTREKVLLQALLCFHICFFLMSSLVRTSRNAEQLYVKGEIVHLPAVWRQHLTWNKVGYETDFVKDITAFLSTSRVSVTKCMWVRNELWTNTAYVIKWYDFWL